MKGHIIVDDRQLGTILAALRYWQREGLYSSGHEQDIASDGGTLLPLSAEEIDALCESLNGNSSPAAQRAALGYQEVID